MRRFVRSTQRQLGTRGAVVRTSFANKNSVEAATQALLQFNIMVNQGIQPDAAMYTSLITTMGRARMEWQAYKLFARLLEQGLTPLPETYEALRQATDPSRKKLIADIEQTVAESIEKLPDAIFEAHEAADRAHSNMSAELFTAYTSVDSLPSPPAVSQPSAETPPAGENAPLRGSMVIPGMRGTWDAQQRMQDDAAAKAGRVPEKDRAPLAQQLGALHKEELRIFLATQRQLRHGTKADLIARVVAAVPLKATSEMLARRKKYFTAVGDELLEQLERSESSAEEGAPTTVPATTAAGEVSVVGGEEGPQITEGERHATSPDVLGAPWGVLRKPLRAPGNAGRTNELRDHPLAPAELERMHGLVALGDIDRVPERELRRYARMHQLRWKRHIPGSLQESVEWHITHFGALGNANPAPTPSLVAQRRDQDALRATLEEHSALQVVGSRAKHVQVVDNQEAQIRALRSSRQHAKESDIVEQTRRRMRNLRQAAELRGRVRSQGDSAVPEPPVQSGGELPPWALRLGDGRFDLKSGEFGRDDGMEVVAEKGMGNFVTEERRRKSYAVDAGFLPGDVRHDAEEHLRNDLSVTESREAEREAKAEFRGYRRSHTFFEQRKMAKKASKEKEAGGGEDDDEGAAAGGSGRRLSSVLRWRPKRT